MRRDDLRALVDYEYGAPTLIERTRPVTDAELFELFSQLAAEDAEWRAKALDAIGRKAALSMLEGDDR